MAPVLHTPALICIVLQVVHRDLKLDNTLLSRDNPPYIKLCDFGFARSWDTGEHSNMTTVIGGYVPCAHTFRVVLVCKQKPLQAHTLGCGHCW